MEQSLTAVEEGASVYQVYPASRITGEGRAEFQGREGMGLNKREARGGGGISGLTQNVRGNYKLFKGINLTILEGMHQFIVYNL